MLAESCWVSQMGKSCKDKTQIGSGKLGNVKVSVSPLDQATLRFLLLHTCKDLGSAVFSKHLQLSFLELFCNLVPEYQSEREEKYAQLPVQHNEAGTVQIIYALYCYSFPRRPLYAVQLSHSSVSDLCLGY